MNHRFMLCGLLLSSSAALNAAPLEFSFTLPPATVAEYHQPYVAVWIEDASHQLVQPLALWHLQRGDDKWLDHLRLWWRRGGRDRSEPIDGVSGATRSPGTYQLSWDGKTEAGDVAPAGSYSLAIEVAREVGDRELKRFSFEWPPTKAETHTAEGSAELGALSLKLSP
ncbi:DUF2271 domain-containing protein [Pokkaliibacter sp. CJK22405]|uniref:DUF2271 domain-containing protein n=1 Tax=Pokkaliibacter sp. CJK22405 TaxID=3384615 RepID=UPI0039853DD2